NNKLGVDYFNRLLENEVDFDIIGLSYYIFYHGSFNNFKANIEDLAVRFGKKIVVAETSYAYTNAPTANAAHILTEPYYNYPLSVQGQADMIRDIIKATVEVPNALGLGIFYWEPAWLPVSNAGWAEVGSPGTWANQAVFSYEGIVLPSIEVFKK
ncbi:MAG: glycosyl hydrolase 53 family protein, partial [Bacilli bacterium]|nr:glycosyl hydrolase 53 family protein [Bacilli bacterium]